MKFLLFFLSLAFLICCGQKQQVEESSKAGLEQESIVVERKPEVSTEKIKPFIYFQKQGIWDSLRSICPAKDQHTFHIADIEKAHLTHIDSSLIFTYIHSIYGLSSVYPLKLIKLPGSWMGLIFLGEQYDADRITPFLAIASIDSTFEKKGKIEFISVMGDDFEESWEVYSVFLNDSSFKMIGKNKYICENEVGNSMTGEVAVLDYEEIYSVDKSGRFSKISTDTLKLIRCE